MAKKKKSSRKKLKVKRYIYDLYIKILKRNIVVFNLILHYKTGAAYNETLIAQYMMRDYKTPQDFIDDLQDK